MKCHMPECNRDGDRRGMCHVHAQRYYRGIRGEKLVAPIKPRQRGLPPEVAEYLKARTKEEP